MADENKGALYVSAVEGHVCTRYGTGLYIGASRDSKDPSQLSWDVERIVMIPAAEAARFRLEYARDLEAGALKKRTSDEYVAQMKAEEDAAKKAAAEAEAAAKKAAAEKKAAEEVDAKTKKPAVSAVVKE